ncbi:MAG: hypothetical protein K2L86_00665 [Lachnospiraceae bacterium]|nr:hypothetical protein [Lachnospiraceae bacterium]
MKKNTKNKRFIGYLILIMLVQAIRYFPFKFGGWNQVQLSFSYEYGFIQRGFLGTLLNLTSKIFHIPWGYMRYVHAFLTMGTFTLLILWIAYKTLGMERLDAEARRFLTGLALVFFMGPGWSTNYSNFALMELWLPILSILGMYLLLKGKMLWCIPVIAVVCELIHTGYVFLYFNLIIMVFVYKILLDNHVGTESADNRRFVTQHSHTKMYVFYGIVTFVLTSVLFLYMMFAATAREGITIEYVIERTAEFMHKPIEEIETQRELIQGYLFRDGGFSGIALDIKDYWLLLIVMLVMFSPFIYEVYYYWKLVVREAGKQGKFYALIPSGIVTVIPMYIMHCDYGRWTYAVFFYEFACIWLLNMTCDRAVKTATSKMMERIDANRTYYLVLLFYAGISGAFAQNLINPMVSMIESYGWKVLEALGLA